MALDQDSNRFASNPIFSVEITIRVARYDASSRAAVQIGNKVFLQGFRFFRFVFIVMSTHTSRIVFFVGRIEGAGIRISVHEVQQNHQKRTETGGKNPSTRK